MNKLTNKDLILLHLSLIDGVGPVTIQSLLRNKLRYSDLLQSDLSRGDLLKNNLSQDVFLSQANLLQNGSEKFDLQDLYLLERADFVNIFGLSQTIAGKIYLGLQDIGVLEKEVCLMSKNNVNFVTLASKNYPELLRNIYCPPAVLYIKSENEIGSWQDLLNYNKKIAFVGSRKANSYGEKIVDNIVPVMVENDWVIVSGGAIGADSMAHEKTVACGGRTIAIIGSGLINPYPSSNEKLFKDILANNGLIISPFGMQTVARPGNFPARNRVIAGLSLGCVVVQAAKKSGASITAHFALDSGREVFAVPGLIYDELSLGCHSLIQQGAKLISDAQDILVEFPEFISSEQVSNKQVYDKKNTEQALQEGIKTANIIEGLKVKSKKSKTFIDESSKIVNKYKEDSLEFEIIRICARACSIDEIAVATNKSLQDLHETLFDMQINGDIKQNYAGMFEIA